ncbi:hypothetical protein CNMCM8980_007536 [Aspergillus fumigatiaffinis]|nr:hypothetical protein CNMCM6457_009373 [Aspergillus fumigatiaffinis]KAF4247236.1 hypothetical protein CNMCM8980_007536 [Aspergillus fumigatiaffinis]
MMKSTILHFLYLCAAALAVLANAKPAQQESLVNVDVMDKQDKVFGHSDAIYDPVPKEDQLFSVEFLEVAPTPIRSDRFFFAFLRGNLPESKKKELALPDEGLVNATLCLSGSVIYADGSYEDPQSLILPFKTATFNDWTHLTIRDARGTQVDYLCSSGRSDILLDFQIPSMFVRSGILEEEAGDRLVDAGVKISNGISSTEYRVYPIYFQPNTKLWKYSIFNNDIFGCEYRHSTGLLGNKLYDVSLPQIGAIVTDVKGWTKPLTPNDRIFEVLGSYAYRGGMSLLPRDMDGFKRLITTIGVFNYLNDAGLANSFDQARLLLAKEIEYADQYMPELKGILAIWKEFEPDFYANAVKFASTFVSGRIAEINQKFPLGGTLGNPAVSKLVYEASLLAKASMDSKPRSNEIALLDFYLSLFDLKPDVPWGFNIYRCSYSNDKAWQRMLHLIDKSVRGNLECEDAMDLYPRHKPVIVEDKEKFNGATSHDVRDHFIAWVAEELPRVVAQPEKFFAQEEFSSTGLRREWTLGARYNFCVFVDDICLESLDKMSSPVVKLLWGQWGPLEPHERNYTVHPEYEDGETDEYHEDVGWTYMSVDEYMGYYRDLNECYFWDDLYVRPPHMANDYPCAAGSLFFNLLNQDTIPQLTTQATFHNFFVQSSTSMPILLGPDSKSPAAELYKMQVGVESSFHTFGLPSEGGRPQCYSKAPFEMGVWQAINGVVVQLISGFHVADGIIPSESEDVAAERVHPAGHASNGQAFKCRVRPTVGTE